MRIAIVAPSSVPFIIGGAEKFWWGLQQAINQDGQHLCELIKLPSPERNFWEIVTSYRRFAELRLDHFDRIISSKYPAWMIEHGEHIVYLQHTLRGLYDAYPSQLPLRLDKVPAAAARLVRLLRAPHLDRSALPELFAAIDALANADLPPDLLALPGPLLREIVHTLDGIALAPRQIRAYYAISATVARRKDYFPPNVEITILPHPSDLDFISMPEQEGSPDSIFTISRLERSKRLDLLIQAYIHADIPLPLNIAGIGPEEAHLRALAAKHPRIRFLGHLNDQAVLRHYRQALFVPFIPYAEDMGLITLEAMRAGKAVLTTHDAGGPTEFVRHGETGLIVESSVDALAHAMRQLVNDPPRTLAMGQAALSAVQHINWPRVVHTLTAPLPVRARRPRWVLLNTFSAYPPDSGGRQRIYHLYRHLAHHADIEHLCLIPYGEEGTWQLTPHFRETRIVASTKLRMHAALLEQRLNLSSWDLAALGHADKERRLHDAIRRAIRGADRVICLHPYLYSALRSHNHPPLFYDAHNVELDLKRSMLPKGAQSEAILATLAEIEGELCQRAERVLVCSLNDRNRLQELYHLPPAHAILVPNGIDLETIPRTRPTQRARHKAQLGLSAHQIALFIGSHHLPNIDAARHIHALARRCPTWLFVILGEVSKDPSLAQPPANVIQPGYVTAQEKALWLATADLAINPMTLGSGSNLKMPEYAAAGLPILTTPHGRRGQPFQPGLHCLEAELADFPAILANLPDNLDELAEAAYQCTVAELAWPAIAERLWQTLRDSLNQTIPSA
ncbi:MAG: glycosyltransferase family 4 protein [Gammaproteobacteria bacterium]|nr:glycosyltransferase family 4 protein [Gammaproteobacteria bacterium]